MPAFDRLADAEDALTRAAVEVMMLNPGPALAEAGKGLLTKVGQVTPYVHLSPALERAASVAQRAALDAIHLGAPIVLVDEKKP